VTFASGIELLSSFYCIRKPKSLVQFCTYAIFCIL